jgi:hypothetical protein
MDQHFNQHQYATRSARPRPLALLLFLAALGVVMASCTSSPTNNNSTSTTQKKSTPTAQSIPTPTVDATLKNKGELQLQTFQQWIALMKQYGGNVDTYQQQYTTDQQSLQNAQTASSYQKSLNTLTSQVQSIQIPALKEEANSLYNKLNQEDAAFGKKHTYYDSYNNTTYQRGFEYDNVNGIDGNLWNEADLQSAQTYADYQAVVQELNVDLYNFQEMVTNFSDKTASDKVHQTDLDLMQHYGKTGKVLVVSLEEQSMRVYDNGKLVKTILTTTGQPDKPSPPGVWWVESRQTNIVFKSDEPKSSPYWYPDTPIHFGMQYHSNGYYIHDAWWRDDFGAGTQFPHQDPTGDIGSGTGSHGCINVSLNDAQWIYNYVDLYTSIIVY